MTRKHFKAIATTLNYSQKHFASDNAYAQLCLSMAHTLKMANSRFDIDKFLAACHEKKSPIAQKGLI